MKDGDVDGCVRLYSAVCSSSIAPESQS